MKNHSVCSSRAFSILLSILLISGTVAVSAPMPAHAAPSCDGNTPTIAGGVGADVILGTSGADVISADTGDDIIIGNGGDDIICGNEGNDTIVAGSGADKIFGDTENDVIDAGSGDNTIYGSFGTDVITSGSGMDYIWGDEDNDVIYAGDGDNSVDGGDGDDNITTGSSLGSGERILGQAGNDCIDSGGPIDFSVNGGGDLGDLVNLGACTIPIDVVPTISITSPADSSTFDDATNIVFTGTATSTKGADLTANIQWWYGYGGLGTSLGSGASVSSTLPQGTQTIVAYVNDPISTHTSVATITVTITAAGPNDPPTAVKDSGTVVNLQKVTIDVAGNDIDSDGTIDPSTVTITGVAANGTAASNVDGTVTYTHTKDGTTIDSFKYTIKDNKGASSNEGTVSITINSANSAPTANDDSVEVTDGGEVPINVVGNDSDTDGTVDPESIIITLTPKNGKATPNVDGTITYSHTASGTTTDSFTYTVNDDDGATSNEATVSIKVTAANIAPVAVNDKGGVDVLGELILNVTSNDIDSDGNLDLSSLVITQAPTLGNAKPHPSDGTIIYVNNGAGLQDIIKYTIDDNLGKTSNEASLIIVINVKSNDNDVPPTQTLQEKIEQKKQEIKQERKTTMMTKKQEKQNMLNDSPSFARGKMDSKFADLNDVFSKNQVEFEPVKSSSPVVTVSQPVESTNLIEESIVDIVVENEEDLEPVTVDANKESDQTKSDTEDQKLIAEKNSDKKKKNKTPVNEEKIRTAAKKLGLPYKNGETKIVAELDNEDNSEALQKIRELGYIDVKNKKLVQATVSIDTLSKFKNIQGVDKIRPPSAPVQFEYPTSEGVYFINADLVHSTGITGSGVKIAIFDLAFDRSNPKITDKVVEVKSFRQGFGYPVSPEGIGTESEHGTAVAEIIADVAPDSELFLYTMGTDVEFAAAVDEAISQDVDIIAMSAGWPDFPTDGSSHITKKVEQAIANDIAFVLPSGNFAKKHWEGSFVDSNYNSWHEFRGNDEGLSIMVTNEHITNQQPVVSYLMWYENNVDKSQQSAVHDFDFVLVDPLGQIAEYSINEQTTTNDKFSEYLYHIPTMEGRYALGISYGGNLEKIPDVTLELFTINDDLEHAVTQGSVIVPSDADGAIVVGAVNHMSGELEPFSSHGPTNNGMLAPHVVGPDGVTTVALKGNPFYGTSATTPYIAGIAALILETNPDLTVEELLNSIQQNAQSNQVLVENAYDYILGYGKADAAFLAE